MKYIVSINICILFLFTPHSYAFNKNEISIMIETVKAEITNIENNFELRKYIPFDVYNDIILQIISASINLKDRNYDRAYFYARMCTVKFQTMKTLIEVAKYRDQTEKLYLQTELKSKTKEKKCKKERDCTIADVPLNPIMRANLFRKGTTFKVDLLDKNLFKPRTFTLSPGGKRKLDQVAEAILSLPDSKIKIVGHTRWDDYRKHSKWKAKVVFRYLLSKGVDPDKTTFLGVGNRVVMNTPWGFRRVKRVEIIIYNIKLNEPEVSSKPQKKVNLKEKKIEIKKEKEEEDSNYKKLEKSGLLKKVG